MERFEPNVRCNPSGMSHQSSYFIVVSLALQVPVFLVFPSSFTRLNATSSAILATHPSLLTHPTHTRTSTRCPLPNSTIPASLSLKCSLVFSAFVLGAGATELAIDAPCPRPRHRRLPVGLTSILRCPDEATKGDTPAPPAGTTKACPTSAAASMTAHSAMAWVEIIFGTGSYAIEHRRYTGTGLSCSIISSYFAGPLYLETWKDRERQRNEV